MQGGEASHVPHGSEPPASPSQPSKRHEEMSPGPAVAGAEEWRGEEDGEALLSLPALMVAQVQCHLLQSHTLVTGLTLTGISMACATTTTRRGGGQGASSHHRRSHSLGVHL